MRRILGSMCLLMGALGGGFEAHASDHEDDPAVTVDPSTDLTDLYAWTEEVDDVPVLNVVLNVRGAFSSSVLYAVHIDSRDAYAEDPQIENRITMVCRFSSNVNVECWLGNKDYAFGNPSVRLSSRRRSNSQDGFVMFAARVPDPAFFNRSGLVERVRPSLEGQPSMLCEPVGSSTAAMYASDLMSGSNDFENALVSSFVWQIDLSLVDDGGPVLALHGVAYDGLAREP